MLIVALVAVIGSGVWGLGVFGQLTEGGYNDPRSESARAAELATAATGGQGGDVIAVYTPDQGTIDDAALTKRIKERLAALPKTAVESQTSYWDRKAAAYASEDRSSAVAVITLTGEDDADKMDAYADIEDALTIPGARVELAGGIPLGHASSQRSTDDLAFAEMVSLPIVLILLLIIFGSLVAALLPVLVGGAAVLGSLGVLHAVALTHEVNSFAVNVASLLGLGMAIDYGLFMVGRFREEQAVHATAEAVRRTVATAGRTVIFSATLLMTALAGLLLFPQGFLKSLAYGGLAAVFLAMLLSLTLLPALLAVLGPRVDLLPIRLPGRGADAPKTGGWERLAGWVLRRPVLVAVPIFAALVVLALPIADARFGENDERQLPAGDPSRVAIETLKADYPQFSSDGVQVVVHATNGSKPDVKALSTAAAKVTGIDKITTTGGNKDTVLLTAQLKTTDVFSDEARDAVDGLRALTPPAGAEVLVGGVTARNVDSLEAIGAELPLMIGLLAGATLVLMFLAFGSILLPIKAVVMSALSLSATFGCLVWIFQEGHGASWLDVTPTPLEAGIVVLMAAVVFGLSTDYEVFLLSRMVEARLRGATTREAVTIGLSRTGRVISAAALLLIVVTGAFALSSVTTMRFIGVGMIIALVLDATVVRVLLVPAVLAVLGDASWWAPGPLRRLQQKAGLAEYAGEEEAPGRHAWRPDDPSLDETTVLDGTLLARALPAAPAQVALTSGSATSNTVVLDYEAVLDYLSEKNQSSGTPSDDRLQHEAPTPPAEPDALTGPDSDSVSSAAAAPVSGAPVSGSPVSAVPVSGASGPGVLISGASVPGALVPSDSVSGSPVSGAAVSGASISGAPVSGAPVSGAPVSGTPVSGAPVSGAPASGVPVSGAPVSGVPVSGAPASGVPVSGAPVSGVPVSGAAGSSASSSSTDESDAGSGPNDLWAEVEATLAAGAEAARPDSEPSLLETYTATNLVEGDDHDPAVTQVLRLPVDSTPDDPAATQVLRLPGPEEPVIFSETVYNGLFTDETVRAATPDPEPVDVVTASNEDPSASADLERAEGPSSDTDTDSASADGPSTDSPADEAARTDVPSGAVTPTVVASTVTSLDVLSPDVRSSDLSPAVLSTGVFSPDDASRTEVTSPDVSPGDMARTDGTSPDVSSDDTARAGNTSPDVTFAGSGPIATEPVALVPADAEHPQITAAEFTTADVSRSRSDKSTTAEDEEVAYFLAPFVDAADPTTPPTDPARPSTEPSAPPFEPLTPAADFTASPFEPVTPGADFTASPSEAVTSAADFTGLRSESVASAAESPASPFEAVAPAADYASPFEPVVPSPFEPVPPAEFGASAFESAAPSAEPTPRHAEVGTPAPAPLMDVAAAEPVTDPFSWRDDPRLAAITAPEPDSFPWLDRYAAMPSAPESTPATPEPAPATPETTVPAPVTDRTVPHRPQTLDDWLTTAPPRSRPERSQPDLTGVPDHPVGASREPFGAPHVSRPATLGDLPAGPVSPASRHRPASLADIPLRAAGSDASSSSPAADDPIAAAGPATPEPAYAEAVSADPAFAEPADTDPKPAKAAFAEPTSAEQTIAASTFTETADTEPPFIETARTEPAFTEPTLAERADIEPAFTEPAFAQSTFTESADIEPTFTEPAFAESTFTESADIEPTFTEPKSTDAPTNDVSVAGPTVNDSTVGEATVAEPTFAESSFPGPVTAISAAASPAADERFATTVPTGTDLPTNESLPLTVEATPDVSTGDTPDRIAAAEPLTASAAGVVEPAAHMPTEITGLEPAEPTESGSATESTEITETPEAVKVPEPAEVPESAESPEVQGRAESTDVTEVAAVPQYTQVAERTEIPDNTESYKPAEIDAWRDPTVLAQSALNPDPNLRQPTSGIPAAHPEALELAQPDDPLVSNATASSEVETDETPFTATPFELTEPLVHSEPAPIAEGDENTGESASNTPASAPEATEEPVDELPDEPPLPTNAPEAPAPAPAPAGMTTATEMPEATDTPVTAPANPSPTDHPRRPQTLSDWLTSPVPLHRPRTLEDLPTASARPQASEPFPTTGNDIPPARPRSLGDVNTGVWPGAGSVEQPAETDRTEPDHLRGRRPETLDDRIRGTVRPATLADHLPDQGRSARRPANTGPSWADGSGEQPYDRQTRRPASLADHPGPVRPGPEPTAEEPGPDAAR
ncbi:MMPL family transporter [Actinoplanes xinjiangensis]|uniref:MMPL family transporter n=1 Tax=Actinoplanes xinjiangensis TaxID=512350 RepID=UPI003420E483